MLKCDDAPAETDTGEDLRDLNTQVVCRTLVPAPRVPSHKWSQVCEQTNNILRHLKASLPYCGHVFFKNMLSKFLAFWNVERLTQRYITKARKKSPAVLVLAA